MRALVIHSTADSGLINLGEPVIGPGDVLVNVRWVGLCGSDLNTFIGANPLVVLPRVPGHEIGGTVGAVGPGVDSAIAVGGHVVVIPYTSCGSCSACRKGRVNACRYNRTLGVQQEGGLCERLVVRADKIIPDVTLPLRHLALVEPLSVGFHAVRRGRVGPGDRVVVLGCGMIGVGAALGAVSAGATVIAVDLAEDKRGTVLGLGIHHFVSAGEEDVGTRIRELTGDEGADVVIEAVGTPDTFRSAVDLACFAGRVVYIGYSKQPVTYDTAQFNLKELDIYGSRNATREDFEAVTSHLGRMGTQADVLISHVFPMNEADQALPYWLEHRAETFKIMVEL